MPVPPSTALPGETFGKLTVIAVLPGGEKRLVRCTCGSRKSIRASHLVAGDSRSCGCEPNKQTIPSTALLGEVFGRLTVIAVLPGKKRLVRCRCGIEKVVRAAELVQGKTQSCGCLNRDRITLKRVALFGETYGCLTVIEVLHRGSGERAARRCQCVCGNILVVHVANITRHPKYCIKCRPLSLNLRQPLPNRTGQSINGCKVIGKVWGRHLIRCEDCGNEVQMSEADLIGGRGCKVCRGDLAPGTRLGHLTVLGLRRGPEAGRKCVAITVRCDCGTVFVTRRSRLTGQRRKNLTCSPCSHSLGQGGLGPDRKRGRPRKWSDEELARHRRNGQLTRMAAEALGVTLRIIRDRVRSGRFSLDAFEEELARRGMEPEFEPQGTIPPMPRAVRERIERTAAQVGAR
jgi:hypothetical protein